jgi:hypothetical protein
MLMAIFQPKLVVVASLLTIGSVILASACGGAAFESGDSAAGGSSAGAATAGMNAGGSQSTSGAGGSADNRPACASPQDCDDGSACTNDFCTIEGKCEAAPKCSGLERCCEGDCAGCCDDSDCEDGIACTTNTCFAGQCMFIPDDGKCQPGEACSVTESCKLKVACGPEVPGVGCEDSSACTTDTCENGFCKNDFCEQGSLCCAGGCALECCSDAQCDTDDPCTVGSCQNGACTTTPLCASSDQCCPSADKTSASCGTCCSASECDDEVSCTKDTCTGARLSCGNHPDNGACAPGEICNPTLGCEKQVQCDDAGDCNAGSCGRCDQGTCKYDCLNNQTCCAGTNTCASCCGDASCDDGIECTVDKCAAGGCTHTASDMLCPATYECHPQLGGCKQCTNDLQCDDGNGCTTDTCDLGTYTCTRVSTCECQTASDCPGIISAKIGLPGGQYCPSCVDGKCQNVVCYGSCCTSGCYKGDICPD